MMYRMLKATLAAFLLTGGGAAAVSAELYPMPPEVGTMRQREDLAELAREASVESDPMRRVQKLLELRELINQIARNSDDESVRDRIAHFLAQTAHIAILNGDHSRGKGGIGYMPNDVTNMPEYVPAEMVALRMTKPRHWVEGLYPKLRIDSSLAGQMIRAAGGFETRGHPFPNFEHIHEALKRTARKEIVTTPKYDGLIHELLMANRMAALLRLLGTERPAFDGGAAPEEFFAFRREILALEAHHAEAVSRYSRLPRDPSGTQPMPFDETSKQLLLELAQRPEWSVHLYVLSYMSKGTAWYDQEIIDRIAAHRSPVSLRFLAAKGMIDPLLVPEPEKAP